MSAGPAPKAGKGIWGRAISAPSAVQSTAGKASGGAQAPTVWQQVNSQLASQPLGIGQPRMNIWQSLATRPGGLWQQLSDETVVSEPGLEGVWSEALDETLVLDRSLRDPELGSRSLWTALSDETFVTPADASIELWREVGEETVMISRPEENVWEKAHGTHGFADLTPTRLPGYAVKKFETAQGEVYYILKNLRQGSYLRLSERQFSLWDLMDGENTIQDIAVAYMTQYGSLDISILIELLGKLTAGGFLASLTTNVYARLGQSLGGRRGLRYWLGYIVTTFLKREFPLPRMDAFYTRTYKAGIWLFYTRPALVIMLVLALAGTSAFLYLLYTQEFSVVQGGASNTTLGLVLLYFTHMLALFVHEGGHAYTCKYYKRTIRKSGVMIYYGFFAFYVDSTDIWMEPRWPRIAVSFGGPFTGFVLGGAAALLAVFSPWNGLNGWAYQFAFLIIIDSVMNLNPLLKWDGYYILMDLLEIPNLRTRALNYLKAGKPLKKLLKRERPNREEVIFTVYGISTFAYTAALILGIFVFFGETIVDFIARFIPPWIVGLVLLTAALFLTRNKIIRFFRRLAGPLFNRRGHSSAPRKAG